MSFSNSSEKGGVMWSWSHVTNWWFFSFIFSLLLIIHLYCKNNLAVDCCQTFTGKQCFAQTQEVRLTHADNQNRKLLIVIWAKKTFFGVENNVFYNMTHVLFKCNFLVIITTVLVWKISFISLSCSIILRKLWLVWRLKFTTEKINDTKIN